MSINDVLSLEEKVLLESLETTDKSTAIHELEGLMMFTPTDNEAHPVIMSLYEKLTSARLNIAEELTELLVQEDVA